MSWNLILKRYRPSMILKKKPVKKKRTVRYKNLLIDQELGTEVDTIQTAYTKWKNTCQGLSLADIGVTGKGHKKDGSAGKSTLLEHVFSHVVPEVQRPGQGGKDGVWQISLEKIDSLIQDEDAIIDEKDKSTLVSFIRQLERMAGSDRDPRNIPFTIAETFKKVGDKWQVDTDKEWFGHYRTAKYIEKRKKVDEVDEKISAVSATWVSETKNTAKPPMWQAIFAGADIPNGGAGDLLDAGILKILQDFKKAVDGAYLESVVIEDKGQFEAKITTLSKLGQLKRKLIELMKDKRIYRGGGHQVKYGGATGLLTLLNNHPFKSKGAARYLKDIDDNLDGVVGSDDIREFKIKFTPATINRLINLWVRGDEKMFVPPHLEPNGKPFLLSDAGGGRKYEGQPWSGGHSAALKNSQIKKSWIDSLWG